jgi:hypothetical protein
LGRREETEAGEESEKDVKAAPTSLRQGAGSAEVKKLKTPNPPSESFGVASAQRRTSNIERRGTTE